MMAIVVLMLLMVVIHCNDGDCTIRVYGGDNIMKKYDDRQKVWEEVS